MGLFGFRGLLRTGAQIIHGEQNQVQAATQEEE